MDLTKPMLPRRRRAPEMPRCLILANPKAGRLAVREYLSTLPQRFAQRLHRRAQEEGLPGSLTLLAEAAAEIGLPVNVEVIPAPDQLPRLIQTAAESGFDTVVAVGGDGTVHNLAQHLVGTPMRLGILPLGTANNFARALGIPSNLEESLRILARGFELRVDVGKIGSEYFLEAAGVGLFADALQNLGAEEVYRHRIGWVARKTLPLCWNPRARHLELTLDGVVQKEHATLVTVSNSNYLGENWPIAPDAGLSDGLFDVVIVGELNRWELIEFGIALMRRRHLTLPKVRYARARTVEIRRIHHVHHPLPVHGDDHLVGYLPARMEVIPSALRVLAPRPGPAE